MRGVGSALAICIVGALLGAACQFSQDRYLQRKVSTDEMPEIWEMTSGSVKDLHDVRYTGPIDPSQHRITLRPDGTCRFNTFVGSMRQLDSECRWRLGELRHQTLDIDLDDARHRAVYYYFTEGPDGVLTLWMHLTDPDAWRYVEYVKVAGSRAPS